MSLKMEENDRDRAKDMKSNRSSSCCLPTLFCWNNYDETSDKYTQEPPTKENEGIDDINASLITRKEWKKDYCFQIKPVTIRYSKLNLFSFDFDLLKKEFGLSISTEQNIDNRVFEDILDNVDVLEQIKDAEDDIKKLPWPLSLQEYNGSFGYQYFRREAKSKKVLTPLALALCVESLHQNLEWNILQQCQSGNFHRLKDNDSSKSHADVDVHFIRIFDKIPKGKENGNMQKSCNSNALVLCVGDIKSQILKAMLSSLSNSNVEIEVEDYWRRTCFSLYPDELSKSSFCTWENLFHAERKHNEEDDSLVCFEEYDHFKVIGVIVYPEETLVNHTEDQSASVTDFVSDEMLYIPLVIQFQSWRSSKIYISKQQFLRNIMTLFQHLIPSKSVLSTLQIESNAISTTGKERIKKQKNKGWQKVRANYIFQVHRSILRKCMKKNKTARNALNCIKAVNTRCMKNCLLRTSCSAQTQKGHCLAISKVIQSGTMSPSVPVNTEEAFVKPIDDDTDLSARATVSHNSIEENETYAKDESNSLTADGNGVHRIKNVESDDSSIVRTTFGFGLDQAVIKDASTDSSAIVAGDEEAFALFGDFYKKAVGDSHPDFNSADLQLIQTASHLETLRRTSFPRINNWSVDHCTVSVFRSIKTFPFGSFANAKQRIDICKMMKSAAEHLNLRYISMETEDPEEKKVLMSNCKLLFPAKAKEQPNYCHGKAILIDQDESKHLLVKVNFEEHVEIRCQVKHGNYKKAYMEVIAMEDQIHQYLISIGLGYCHDNNFGYLNSSLKNIGRSLLMQVEMIIPELLRHPLYSEIIEHYALKKRYQGRKRGKTFDVIKLERMFTFATNEIDAVSQFYETTTSLIEMEKRLSRRRSIRDLLPDHLKYQSNSDMHLDRRRDRNVANFSPSRTHHGRQRHNHSNPVTETQSNQSRSRRAGQNGTIDGGPRAGKRSGGNTRRGNLQ